MVDADNRIGNISCPLLVIHGTRDEIVPFWNGESLFFAAPVKWRARPMWIDGAGHNNIEIILR
jgi:abhydrolase domain-containing protein 17